MAVKFTPLDFWTRHADLVSLRRDLRYIGYSNLNLKHFNKLKKEVDEALKIMDSMPLPKEAVAVERTKL